ncbi:MAG: extracellular solute-binding protein [Actinomycetota bacterium]|nr:extracellular solute-binding protein [Actinomycetota bacterium]
MLARNRFQQYLGGSRSPQSRYKSRLQSVRRVSVGFVGGSLILSACGSAAAAPTTTTSASNAPISFQLWESHNGGPVGDAVTALVNMFDSSHPNIHVSIVVTKASSKLPAAVAAGDPPVLAEISHYDGTLVKGLALNSWNQYMKNDPTFSQSNLYPSVWSNGLVGNQHYRLIASAKVSEVFYNESMFQAAGITTPPTTWAELASDAAKLKSSNVIPLGWKDSSAHILPAILSNGGSMLNGSNTVGTSVNFNNAATTATFQYFRNLYSAGDLVFDHGSTLRADLASGHMAMIDGTSAGEAKVLAAVGGKFKVGAFVEPAGSTGHAANLVQGLGFVLPKGHSAAEDNAAFTFVNWWYQPAQQVYWSEHTGFAPMTKAGAAAIPQSFLSSHPGLQQSIVAMSSQYSYPRPVSDSYAQVQAVLDSAFQQAVTGSQSISAALTQLQSQGNSYMSGASAL